MKKLSALVVSALTALIFSQAAFADVASPMQHMLSGGNSLLIAACCVIAAVIACIIGTVALVRIRRKNKTGNKEIEEPERKDDTI